MKLETLAEVTEGKLVIPDREGFYRAVREFDGKVVLTIQPWKRKRSGQQNKWYWGVAVGMIKDALMEKGHDYSPEEVHESMKWKFLQRHEEGLELPTVRSTTVLTTIEFMEYTEKIQRWASEYLDIVIPDPGQTDWL